MRKGRVLKYGAKYHVSAKINRNEDIFEPDEIKQLYLDTIKAAKKKYKFSITNFVIMNNHIHFIIEPLGDENLSMIMKWIQQVFSIYYNNIHKLKGHTWQSRFFSKIIEDIKQFIDTFLYIKNNPEKAGIVSNAYDYKYNGVTFIKNKIFDIMEPPDDLLSALL